MSLLDSLLGMAGQDIDVAGIAEKFGLDPAVAAQAVAALGVAHSQPGDTVETAAGQTGIDTGTLSQVAGELGGSEGLGQLNQAMQNHPQAAGLMSMFDGAGDGGGGGLLGLAKGFFGNE
jgi:hypothetical protein